MQTAWTLPAPAKVNLFLHITGKRSDGYHNLETLFQILDWGDVLEFQSADQLSLQQDASVGVSKQNNLIFKAARLLAEESGCKQGIAIHLKKQIPAGAGLGGGSSDAATTLLALNRIWKLGLSISELSELGLKLGADVPVFIQGETAFASGVGEQLIAMDQPQNWFLVVTPNVHISTAEIFSHSQLTRDTRTLFPADGSRLLTRDMSDSKMCALAVQGGRNDCQRVAEMLYPEVAKARKTLEKLTPVSMSGTGSSLFAQFASQQEAEQIAAKLADEGLNDVSFFIAQGINRSPVHQLLADCNH